MIRSFAVAGTGMIAQQTLVDNISNNLANVSTTGFKRNELLFQDLVYTNLTTPGSEVLAGAQVPTGLQLGNGVRVAGNSKIFTEGSLVNTGNPFDMAITGEGFFQVILPDGTTRYTRDGAFRINSAGALVNSDGFTLTPAITIPNDAISATISTDGTVSVVTGGAPTTSTVVGNITLARFPNPAGLSAEGRNLFNQTAASGAPVTSTPGQTGTGLIQQGFLESSNVEVVQELVGLLTAQRAYEFNTKAVTVTDNMLNSTLDLVR